ncbi:MAG TPA: hypothetical protein PLL88_10745, partial [Anaerolineaceae bacterium]|nr:hypothetical protein [Anaerolineaceae bacterium]
KGGKNNGYFIVISLTATQDMQIPGQSISFQQLLLAQTLGDMDALEAAGRKVLYLHLKNADLATIIKHLH